MVQYTVPHSLPTFETTDPIAAVVTNLRTNLNGISTAANSAITAEGARAETAAIDDATTKYGGLPARVTAVESKNTTQDGRLDTLEGAQAGITWDKGVTAADLNTVQTSGRYTVNATNVVNQPVAAAGSLEVLWGSTTGTQRYTVRETNPRVYLRNYSSGTWGAWGKGETGVRLDAIEAKNVTQDTAIAQARTDSLNDWGAQSGRQWNEHLDLLLTRGTWLAPSTGMTTLGWPTSTLSIAVVFHWGTTNPEHVIQLIIPRLEGAWYWRSKFGTAWSAWGQLNPAKQARTGWVDISSGVGATVSSHGGIRVYRDGDMVWCIGNSVTFSSTGTHNVAAIPVGYRPATLSGMNYRHEPAYSDSGSSIRPTSYFSGNLRILDAQVGVPYNFAVTWPTTDAKIS